ncbi:hypothetical protein apy_14450 [Aeropyrum pernix]|uniref:Uncharacterized protein n=1 Tax=Aeropyrum pernix TaxID=56636 RepID=A0A401HBG2_AERPX|nr:hypothetical protein apy_14450 [Aeropyrum pernix]
MHFRLHALVMFQKTTGLRMSAKLLGLLPRSPFILVLTVPFPTAMRVTGIIGAAAPPSYLGIAPGWYPGACSGIDV